MTKKVLVTGASGFNGIYMVKLLLENNYHVIATDMRESEELKKLHVPFYTSDLNIPQQLEPVLQNIDTVFHIAALFDYLAPLENLRQVNVEGTKNLMTCGAKQGIRRFMIWSSLGIYGAPDITKLPVTEDSLKKPSNDYEQSKLEQEEIAFELGRKLGIEVTAIRPSPIYGPGNKYGIVALPLMIARGQLPFCVKSIPTSFSCVHVMDVVRAALFLSEKKEAVGEAFNICDDRAYPHAEYIQYYAQLLGEKITVFPYLPKFMYNTFFKCLYSFFLYKSKKMAPQKPQIDPPMIQYVLNHYEVSNAKIKKCEFQFQYPDFTKGAWETVQWIKKELV